jgi:hypothetical protein
MQVKSLVPASKKAERAFSGRPQSPKPPNITVEPSGTVFTITAGLSITLEIIKRSSCGVEGAKFEKAKESYSGPKIQ